MDHLSIWFLKQVFPLGSPLPIRLEITLLQLHWNWTKKHLVVNGTANLHMVSLCGWDHLVTCLQSSSPDSHMITSQRPTLQLCLSSFFTVKCDGWWQHSDLQLVQCWGITSCETRISPGFTNQKTKKGPSLCAQSLRCLIAYNSIIHAFPFR